MALCRVAMAAEIVKDIIPNFLILKTFKFGIVPFSAANLCDTILILKGRAKCDN